VHFGVNAEVMRLWMARSRRLDDFVASSQGRFRFGNDDTQDFSAGVLITVVPPRSGVQPVRIPASLRTARRSPCGDDDRLQTYFGAPCDIVGRVVNVNESSRTTGGAVPKGVDLSMLLQPDSTNTIELTKGDVGSPTLVVDTRKLANLP
jgi:hypothetical protein